MPGLPLPELPAEWVLFADWSDLLFGLLAIFMLILLAIWWRQQISTWWLLLPAALVVAGFLCLGSLPIFQVPPHFVGCPGGCAGWQGYPIPFVSVGFRQEIRIAPVDFALNLLLLWLLLLGAMALWRLLAIALRWPDRSLRYRLLVTILLMLPLALSPRFLDPPQPILIGEDQRLSINAQRTAQFTYGITGPIVQRLALEDIRELPSSLISVLGQEEQITTQVCLRGYTYFYIPWRRYLMIMDTAGVVALNLTELPVEQSCW